MINNTELLNPHKWVEAYADYLYAYAIARINDEEQAKDLVQETFLAALEKVNSFEGKSLERTWLTAILRNKIIDVYRKKSSRLLNADVEKAEDEQADFFDPEDGHWMAERAPREFGIAHHDPVVSKEFNHILQKCMQKLPALWMSVFTMKHMEDQTTDIICTELKLTSANFWVIIHRTKLNLRACLQKNWI
jgi:RNA polymerase sigma-70 factor (TIGR02943 family)